MGCGASTSIKRKETNQVITVDDSSNVNTALRDLRTVLSGDFTNEERVQEIILPLSKEKWCELNSSYHRVHSLREILSNKLERSALFWDMLLSPCLGVEYVKHLLGSSTEIKEDGVRQIIELLLSVKDISEFKKQYLNETGEALEVVLKNQVPLNDNTLATIIAVETKEELLKALTNNPYNIDIDLYREKESKFYSKLLKHYIDNNNIRAALFLLLSRRQVDLEDVVSCYQEDYGTILWNDVNNILPVPILKLHLIHHSDQTTLSNNGHGNNVNNNTCKVPKVDNNPKISTDLNENFIDHDVAPCLSSPPQIVIIPDNNKSIEELAEELHKILNTENVDISTLNDAVSQHFNSHDLHELPGKYNTIYPDQDFLKRLKEIVTSDSYTVLQAAVTPYHQSSATLLKSAIQNNDSSTVDLVLMVLLCSDSQQIKDICKHFATLSENDEDLSDVLSSNLLGEFQGFVVALLKGDRDRAPVIDEKLAREDALRLSQATDFKWSGEDSVFNDVFISRSFPQLQTTFKYYTEIAGSDITDLILNEFSLHLQKALLNLVYVVNNGIPKFLAKFLYESRSKSHFTAILIWIVASRSKVDLQKIKEEFAIKHEESVSCLLKLSKTDDTTTGILKKMVQK